MVPIASPRPSSNLSRLELTSLALESLKRVWEVSGGSLEVSGRSLGSLSEVSGSSLEIFWEFSGRSLRGKGLQKASEGHGLKK